MLTNDAKPQDTKIRSQHASNNKRACNNVSTYVMEIIDRDQSTQNPHSDCKSLPNILREKS